MIRESDAKVNETNKSPFVRTRITSQQLLQYYQSQYCDDSLGPFFGTCSSLLILYRTRDSNVLKGKSICDVPYLGSKVYQKTNEKKMDLGQTTDETLVILEDGIIKELSGKDHPLFLEFIIAALYRLAYVDDIYSIEEERDIRKVASVFGIKKTLLDKILLYRSEEHTSELQSLVNLVCRLLLEKQTRPTLTYLD